MTQSPDQNRTDAPALDLDELDRLIENPGSSGVVLNHPSMGADSLTIGRTIRRLLKGETKTFTAVVGYFHHSSAAGQDLDGDPAAIILEEAEEETTSFGVISGDHCAFYLQSGAICSEQAAVAARLWYWVCRWKQTNPSAADEFRSRFLDQCVQTTNRGGSFADACEALLDIDEQESAVNWPVREGVAFGENVPLLPNETRKEVRDAWRSLLATLGMPGVKPASVSSNITALVGSRAPLRRSALVLFGFLLQRRGSFKVAPQRAPVAPLSTAHVATFHPKLYVVEGDGPNKFTACIVGSSNWSRSAMAVRPGYGIYGDVVGNVEISTIHTAKGHWWSRIPDTHHEQIVGKLCAAGRFVFERTGEWIGSWTSHERLPGARHTYEVLTAVESLPEWEPPITQVVTKRGNVEECTPLEKAWLVLYDHISHMVGEAQTLHVKAQRYQAAAYQRQAAQRIAAQLENYQGAMLCDGVGLGKTYVATTVMVHYANSWRDRLAVSQKSADNDPFRITVLAPNSVVSTWQREAIPPLAAQGVPLETIRVLSHTKLSRIRSSSEILSGSSERPSDMEHLLLSDLVIVDEAHNFRSVAARRTVVLRDLLRLQPRKDIRRKVLLLTATPVNNSLEDLRQQASLLFSKPFWFNDNQTPDGYRSRVLRDVKERVEKARGGKGRDVAATLIYGSANARFSAAIDFRDDLQFGVQIPRVGDYLKVQEKLLQEQQEAVRAAMTDESRDVKPPQVRVASELLDRIVVQRSRKLCKQIEREQGSNVKLLFRRDAPPPEKLVYEDVYDDTRDVLARFLPLFDTSESSEAHSQALSLKVYIWSDVRDGSRQASDPASVIGLQRVLVLKRLESSPVSFLITLLRLLALYAHRLRQLLDLCHELEDHNRADELGRDLDQGIQQLDRIARDRLDLLLTGEVSASRPRELLTRWSEAHTSARPAAGADDPAPSQLELFEAEDDDGSQRRREHLDRLWNLKDDLEADFQTLLSVAPGLADIVFGRFEPKDWPRNFIVGGSTVDWPTSSTWGLRIVTDAKLRRLVTRLLQARQDNQRAIVFSQFGDTLAYIESVFRSTASLTRSEWQPALRILSADVGERVTRDDVRALTGRTAVVIGESEDRDATINAFAPYYRIGPVRPAGLLEDDEVTEEQQHWTEAWTRAIEEPVEVLLASDVLAEGVNLQDASLLVNYDVHWNPVRMIQRAGRVDRRLNPRIEEATGFPDVERLAASLQKTAPRYWWHDHPDAAPVTVNLLLPDQLEAELHLRERIANKTLAIDFTLGLERGTGAEAEWMSDYSYHGISALDSWQGDRAIEQLAGYQERLRQLMSERGIVPEWVSSWNGWLRERTASDAGPILAWALLGRKGGELAEYTRYLEPVLDGGVPHWLWTTAKPVKSNLNFWLSLDGKTFPAAVRTDLGWSENASRPLSAEDLLGATTRLVDGKIELEELGREIGRPVMQGASAISAGYLSTESDRKRLQVGGFRLLQLASLKLPEPPKLRVERRGIARKCGVCGHAPGMHKCCPSCGASADGESEIETKFGFRRVRSSDGTSYEIPQTWCRACRQTRSESPLPESEETC